MGRLTFAPGVRPSGVEVAADALLGDSTRDFEGSGTWEGTLAEVMRLVVVRSGQYTPEEAARMTVQINGHRTIDRERRAARRAARAAGRS